MCAILDANVVHEVFGDSPPAAGIGFFRWVNSPKGGLVSGGRNYEELRGGSDRFRQWVVQSLMKGSLRLENEEDVSTYEEDVIVQGRLMSDDPHMIALALVSGVRLLYSNDRDLQKDFKNRRLIGEPKGAVYSTTRSKEFTPAKRKQLSRPNLCTLNH